MSDEWVVTSLGHADSPPRKGEGLGEGVSSGQKLALVDSLTNNCRSSVLGNVARVPTIDPSPNPSPHEGRGN
ncbi:hypothetical protein Pla175_03010 [Pirellulimonas nuda]|uniref:Uncharacterized protein n=1 Tax=Pirellulimonas nuda TaxID=2528009 RepID=A0A518D656_9BACT|nr:hypothetical protein Pla175_03010 [Pirellulimonas nuda]